MGKKINYIDLCAFVFCLLFIIAGSLVSLNRYWQFEVFYYDFGIFDQAIWKVAHFSAPIIDHLVVGGKWIFADHFNPSIFLLSPLYWFTQKSEIILIAQAAAVGLSGLFLYLIGKEVLKNRLISLSVVVSYFLFVGVQNAVITDFHEITVAVLFFILCFYAVVKKNFWCYIISFLIFLGFKESNFITGMGIAVAIFFIRPSWIKTAIFTFLFSLLWGYLSINIIIPFFSGGIYQYNSPIPYNPINIFSSFFDNPIKRHTIFYSYLSFGFLPLISPIFWLLQFQDLLTRMYSPLWTLRWDLGLHYSVMMGAILSLSTIFGLSFILRKLNKQIYINIIAITLIINSIFLYRFVLRGPFGLSYNPAFYGHTKEFLFLNRLVSKVPKNASITAPNNLVSHFTHQPSWMLFSNHKKGLFDTFEKHKPQYVVIDIRQGQNPNNYFGIDDIFYMYQSISHDKNYLLFYHSGDQYIFKRK